MRRAPMLDMLAAWLSVETDEAQDLDARREAVRMSAELGQRRGHRRAGWSSRCG